MNPSQATADSTRPARLLKAINDHGYPFHTRVLRETESLREARLSPWNMEVTEFPVEADLGTRIDFVLSSPSQRTWLLAECKRVNPEYSDWMFLRTNYVRRNHTERYIAEHSTNSNPLCFLTKSFSTAQLPFFAFGGWSSRFYTKAPITPSNSVANLRSKFFEKVKIEPSNNTGRD